jgi:hypothetical protein
MKRVRLAIWVMLVVLVLFCLGLRTADADSYNDGGTHNIDSKYNNGIVIENSSSGAATTVNIVSGGSVPNFTITGDSYLNVVSGGSIAEEGVSDAYDNAQIDIQGGTIVGGVRVHNNVRFSMISGTINQWIRAYDDSVVDISGGIIRSEVMAYDDSIITISNGQIWQTLQILSIDSIVTIFGTNFILDGSSVHGEIFNTLAETNYGHLTGYYLDGGPINMNLEMQPGTSITLVPEPASAMIMALGATIISLRRRKC